MHTVSVQQTILIDLAGPYRSVSLYYRYTLGMTFNTLSSWEWENQPYFKQFKNYVDCVVLGVL